MATPVTKKQSNTKVVAKATNTREVAASVPKKTSPAKMTTIVPKKGSNTKVVSKAPKQVSPTKMATTAIKKIKAASSKKVSLTPSSETFRTRDDGSNVFKATNAKGKFHYINSDKENIKKNGSGQRNSKSYSAYAHQKPTYEVTTTKYDKKGKPDATIKNFEKSIDTTGYSAGRKQFPVVTKQKLSGGNMYKITNSTTDRKGAISTINKMKKKARQPFS